MSDLVFAPDLITAAQVVLRKFGKSGQTRSGGAAASDSGVSGPVRYQDLPADLQERFGKLISPVAADQRIAQLFHGGWDKTYESQSQADLAFCSKLARRGFTSAEVDLLLRASVLYREKWENRSDYRQSTLSIAFASISTEAARQSEWVDQLNQRYAMVNIGSDVMVADTRAPSACAADGVEVKFLKVSAFKAMLAGQVVDEASTGKKVPLADSWLRHPNRSMYDGVEFAPDGSTSDRLMNLWRGYQLAPQQGDVRPWLDTLRGLIPSKADQDYVLKWLAFKVQNPGAVCEVVLILKGNKGVGKNSLFEPVQRFFGPHAMVADDPEMVFGKYNGHLMDKAFVVLDEAVFAADAKLADRIKSRVTGRSLMYEFKGLTPMQAINRCAYVMLTNHDHVWRASVDERRAAVIETCSALKGNARHWDQFHAWCSGSGPAALLHYLDRLELGRFHPRDYKHGAAMAEQIRQTILRDPLAAWWYSILEGSEVPAGIPHAAAVQLNECSPTEVPAATLQASYENATKGWGSRAPLWPNAMKTVSKWADGRLTVHRPAARACVPRPRHYLFPPVADLRVAFQKQTGIEVVDLQLVQEVQGVQDDS